MLAHEARHALTARAVGLLHGVGVVADLWGGHTQFTEQAPDPGRSALVAVVGPMANAVLAGAGVALPAVDDVVVRLLLVARTDVTCSSRCSTSLRGCHWTADDWLRRRSGGSAAAAGPAPWSPAGAASGRRPAVLWLLGRPLVLGRQPTAFGVILVVLVAGLLWRGASGAVAAGQVRRVAERLDLAAYLEPAAALSSTSTGWRPGSWPGIGVTAASISGTK